MSRLPLKEIREPATLRIVASGYFNPKPTSGPDTVMAPAEAILT